MPRHRTTAFYALTVVALCCLPLAATERTAIVHERIGFDTQIRPILAQHCTACHGGVKQAGGLSFVYKDRVLGVADSGVPIVVPGDVDASYLLERVKDTDPDTRMPPSDHGRALSEREVRLLSRWIEEGAEWARPWAFEPPLPFAPPRVSSSEWCQTTVDHFVLARLESEGLSPSGEAPRRSWLRRVTLDLIGLPPTLEELRNFDRDSRPDAYAKVVDRLLDSPRFGERWASMWLDLARYADTMGYEKDLGRTVWPYRDWLIRAINNDMPYDEFIIKQLAGDLLPNPSLDDRIATAFHRNTQTNTEGGTDDEEFRVSAIVDRLNTTWQVFGAMTFGCAQCHAHPYDPFENEEYYQCLAFFNGTRDADLHDDYPWLEVPTDRDRFEEAAALDARKCEIESQLHGEMTAVANDIGIWNHLPATHAETTGNAQLTIREEADGKTEVWAEGTLSVGSQFTIEYELPSSLVEFAALRIDALPHDPEQALRVPEFGFVLSRLKAWIVPEGGQPQEVVFTDAFCDEAHPQHNPLDSLKDTGTGWSQYTRLSRPCFAVFVLREPQAIPPRSVLRLEFRHNLNANDTTAMSLRRTQVAGSSDASWFQARVDPKLSELRSELREVRARRRSIPAVRLPVMQVREPIAARRTFAFVRGSWLDHDAEVMAGVPNALHVFPKDSSPDRLGLANWFASASNPLTARVAVNRIWEQLFGIGLVETTEDFGTSGSRPSHPELLDHLACKFQGEQCWSTKALLREIVLSATYRQTSKTTPEMAKLDPRNRLLARGPRNRLTAEMIRDQAMTVSGLLSDKMYGPPVMPPQPDGIWKSVYNGAKWKEAEGEDRYRRAIYTFWKRTSAYPSMLTFDAPSREVCTSRRIATNTPLQALVTLNDPAYVECCEALAKRMRAKGGQSPREWINFGYEATIGEPASMGDTLDLLELYGLAAIEFFDHQSADSCNGGISREAVEHFALTAVASAILNSDRALTK